MFRPVDFELSKRLKQPFVSTNIPAFYSGKNSTEAADESLQACTRVRATLYVVPYRA